MKLNTKKYNPNLHIFLNRGRSGLISSDKKKPSLKPKMKLKQKITRLHLGVTSCTARFTASLQQC